MARNKAAPPISVATPVPTTSAATSTVTVGGLWRAAWPQEGFLRAARVAFLVSALCATAIAYQALANGNDRTYLLQDNVLKYEIVQNVADAPVETRVILEDAPVRVSLALLVVLFFAFDGLFFLLSTLPAVYSYMHILYRGGQPLQFVQYAFSSTCSFLAIALVLGVRNSHAFNALACMNVVTMVCGLMSDLLYVRRKQSSVRRIGQRDSNTRHLFASALFASMYSHGYWWMFGLGSFVHMVQWYTVIVSFVNSIRFSTEPPPSFVYAIVSIMAAVHVYFACAQFAVLWGFRRPTVEAMNILMSPASKFVLGWLLYSNVLAP